VSETGRWALIVADGDGVPAALSAALAEADAARGHAMGDGVWSALVIAADGGARRALEAGVIPDLVVGDGDSVMADTLERLESLGIPVELAPTDKDESDTELCLRAALVRGATSIRIVGALGGPRLEHGVANLLLLAHPMLDGVDAAIVAPPSVIRRVGREDAPGSLEVHGAPGDHVSLLPLDTVVEGVRTQGLRFPLHDEPLRPGPARGLSNAMLATVARVTTGRGRLLVIHTTPQGPRTEPRS
jgi:thiamine pyrophosphokinase